MAQVMFTMFLLSGNTASQAKHHFFITSTELKLQTAEYICHRSEFLEAIDEGTEQPYKKSPTRRGS